MPHTTRSETHKEAQHPTSSRAPGDRTEEIAKTTDPHGGSEAFGSKENKGSHSHLPGPRQSPDHEPRDSGHHPSSTVTPHWNHPLQQAPQPNTLDENALHPYDPTLRMDVLTNEALLMMLKSWADYPIDARGVHPVVHVHVGRIREEMVARGIIDEAGTYLVNFDDLDMGFQRVAGGSRP